MKLKNYVRSYFYHHEELRQHLHQFIEDSHLMIANNTAWRLRLLREDATLCLNAAERKFNERISKIS